MNGSGIGLPTALTLLFVGLKLGSVIDWSWWWVLSPLWISILLGLLVFLIVVLVSNCRPRYGHRSRW